MAVTGPKTGFKNGSIDLGDMFVSKDYILDVYPSLIDSKKTPGVFTCGYGYWGALGLGNTGDYSSPVQVGSLTTWKNISLTRNVSLFLKTDGTLWGCGYNGYGQIGNGTTNIQYSSPVQVGSLTDWKQVATGYTDCKGIKTNGSLWTWGVSTSGNLGLNDDTLSYSSPIQVGSLTDWKQVDSFGYFSLAVKTDGTLWSWGDNTYGQLGNENTTNYSSPVQVGSLTDWKQVSAGSGISGAVKTNGTLWMWGDNYYGQLANGNTTRYSSPIQVGALTNWKQVSCGQHGGGAIKTDGTLWMWGNGYYGELGQGDGSNYSSPVQVGTLTNWKEVSCGYLHVAALKTDGTVWSMGRNDGGQLGTGDNTIYSSPVQIGTLNTWKLVHCAKQWKISGFIKDGYM